MSSLWATPVTITVSSMSLMTTMRARSVGTSTHARLRTGSSKAGRTSSTSTCSHTGSCSGSSADAGLPCLAAGPAGSGVYIRRAVKNPFSSACTLCSLVPWHTLTSAPGTGRLASAR